MKVLQHRNFQLSNKLQELESAKVRETNDECYRFSFGAPFNLEDYQDRMKDLIKEHLIQKGINCKVKLLSNGTIFGDFLDKNFEAKKEKLNKSMEYRKSPVRLLSIRRSSTKDWEEDQTCL